ncbi:oligosaccharide flippase family protein [Candidatus Marsarchaeota archaeon]|nr:oligosaccharide flippase family protein [Candidatus Marsarchaeota archaeon]
MTIDEKEIPQSTLEIGSKAMNVASFILGGKVISLLLLAASFIIVVRLLGPSNYGLYILVLATVGFFGAIGNFGVGSAFNKFIPEYRVKNRIGEIEKILANGFAIILISNIVLILIILFLSGFFANTSFHNFQIPAGSNQAYPYSYIVMLIQIGSLSLITGMLYNISIDALIGFQKGKHLAISTIVLALVQSVLSIVLIFAGFGALAPLLGYIAGLLAAFLVAVYFLYIPNKLRIVRPSFEGIKKLIRFSWPIAVSNFFGTVMNNLILIILGLFAVAAVIGNLGVAVKTGSLIDLISGSISISLIPAFSIGFMNEKIKKSIGKMYSYSVYFSFVFLTPMIAALVVFSKQISYTAFGGVYALAPEYIAVFGIGFLIGIFSMYNSQLLISANKVRKLLKYNIIIVIIQLALIPVLIPTLGGLGAAMLTFLVGPIIMNIVMATVLRKEFAISFKASKLFRLMVANLAVVLAFLPVFLFLQSHYILQIALAVIIVFVLYPPLLAITKAVGKNEIDIMYNMTSKIPIVNKIIPYVLAYSKYFM